ncbi:ATP-binding protein [Rhizobium lemnae]|uniref:histidine kinase n=1 Tax=Rhizobium lemnae TaxID=1214924 RepID=A0ABV8EBV2_9HYPH|nr:ATP-binding protein [Rhizobium lemnae]MCJ8506464.1 ATP-binding protein [Rhizobium lemnae]
MSSVQYPFIDLAVHERVRLNYAAGKAVIIFSAAMDEVIWANGAGAQLFGQASIYDLIEQGPPATDLTFRQAKASARPLQNTGDTRSFLIRMTAGFDRVTVQANLELISLPNGDHAVLLAVPAGEAQPASLTSASQMLQGFDDPSTHMAVLDHQGDVITASSGFSGLALSAQTIQLLVRLAGSGPDRLIKRAVPTGFGSLPTAIARLSDEPALYLVMLVQPSPTIEEVETETAVAEDVIADQPTASGNVADAAFETALDAVTSIDDMEEELDEDPDFVSQGDEDPADHADIVDETETSAAVVEPLKESVANSALIPDASDLESSAAQPVSPHRSLRRETRATRFVWKIDADGYFSEISPELAASVGPHAAEIVGLSFTDVAALFNLDPEGKIAELLNRRDTWSGKTIWWPVEGTSAVVPIDLAALPTYSRNREFDGFRGFGIIRLADAEEDEHAIGLTFLETGSDPVIAEDATQDESAAEEAPDATNDAANSDGTDENLDLTPVVTAAESQDAQVETTEVEAETVPQSDDAASQMASDEPADADASQPIAETTDESTIGDDAVTEEEVEAYYVELDEWVPEEGDERATPTDAPAAINTPIPLPAFEKPVLRIIENPGLRYSDKVIRFDERRSNLQDGLTAGEQAAFREIARKLDAFRRGEDPKAEMPKVTAEEQLDPKPSDVQAVDTPEAEAEADSEVAPIASASAASFAPRSLLEADEEPVDAADPDVQTEESEAVKDGETAADDNRISLAEAYAQAIPLRPRPELTAEIIDQMPVALLVHSGDTLIHANPEFLRLTGYAGLEDLNAVGGLDALLQRQDLDDKTHEAGGMVVVREDDSIVPVTARLQSVRYDGATALILALMPSQATVEMTEPSVEVAPTISAEALEEHARQAGEISRLQVEVEELRAILDTATDGVVLMGADGTIRSMNRAANALFNYDNEQTSGKPFVMLFAHESQKSVLDYLHGLSSHGVVSLLNDGREVIGREAGGGFVPLFMTIGKLTSSNGYCAVIRDITQWKRTEDELRSAKRAAETANAHKSDFLAHVSHEIRTPLNAIIGFADMMATERLGPIGHARYIEYANDIGRSGRHVLDIVNDLLDISKIEAGEMELDFVSVGLNETIAEAVSLVQPQANTQRVIIRTALSHAVPPVVADLRSVKQIVLNILSNAIRFTPSGGQIVVSTSYETNGSVVLRVRDTGIGMTRSELELAMKPFRQVAGASRKRGDGTGLGLPLTKAMVDANRAVFTIHSAPNEGTLVEITFPSPRVLAN